MLKLFTCIPDGGGNQTRSKPACMFSEAPSLHPLTPQIYDPLQAETYNHSQSLSYWMLTVFR